MDCAVCQAAGIRNHSPAPSPAREPSGDGGATSRGPRRPLRLTDPQVRFLRQVWDHLATERAGSDPDGRLLALIILLRAARSGRANFTAQDVRGLRAADPLQTVTALTQSGWLRASPEGVMAADAQNPAICAVPLFTDNPWDVGKKIRTRASGWSTGVLAHKLLRKKSNSVRLTALYLLSHATPDGMVEFRADDLVQACALDGLHELVSVLGELVTKGWLADLPTVGATGAVCPLSDAVAGMVPEPPAVEETARPPSARELAEETQRTDTAWPDLDSAATVTERAQLLISGREAEVADWVRDFRSEHGHGPNWATVIAAYAWPSHRHRHSRAAETAFVLLAEEGWLSGLSKPYGLSPGTRLPEPALPTQ